MSAAGGTFAGIRVLAPGESRWRWLEIAAAWLLALLWLGPLFYAFWAAFHPWIYATRFELFAPLTLENLYEAWSQAPFARYYLNTFLLVSSILVAQFVLCTLAGYAFARLEFFGRDVAFALIKTEGLDEVGHECIVREAQAMGRLGTHPHVVSVVRPEPGPRLALDEEAYLSSRLSDQMPPGVPPALRGGRRV